MKITDTNIDILTFNLEKVRAEFPILQRDVNGKPLVYLDNAATTQKPKSVIDSISHYYTSENANIHRGLHFLSELATERYEEARVKIKSFINAMSASEIVFVRGTTEAINLVATTFERSGFLKEGDEIIITNMEHHANIVPWQLICNGKVKLRVVPINDKGEIEFEEYKKLFNERTKFVSVVHVSNALGTINPVKEIINYAHGQGIPVLLDGAQAVAHSRIDVQELDCDFYAFSGHKLFGPTGIGVLYGKTKFLQQMPPYQGGGDMIRTVTFEKTTFDDIPNKFEAGTPNIVGGIALGTAIDFLNSIDRQGAEEHEKKLLEYATEQLLEIEGLRIIGTSENKLSVISFTVEGIHPYDIGTILDTHGIAIRTGHHCTQPLMRRYNLSATARASFAFYNTFEEIDRFTEALKRIIKMFK